MNFKSFVTYFLLFFIIFSIIGFINGRRDVREKGFLKQYVSQKISIEEINGINYLAYKRENNNIYLFNTDSDTLSLIDIEAILRNDTSTIKDRNLLNFLSSSTIAALGTGFLGYKIKDGFKYSNSLRKSLKNSRGRGNIIASIFGTISGYSLGYWISYRTCIPSENSKDYVNTLMETDFWKYSEKKLYVEKIDKVRIIIKTIEDSTLRLKFNKEIHSLIKGLPSYYQDGIHEIKVKSKHFKILLDIEKKLKQFDLEAPSEPSIIKIVLIYIIDSLYIIGIILLIFVFGAFVFFILYRKHFFLKDH